MLLYLTPWVGGRRREDKSEKDREKRLAKIRHLLGTCDVRDALLDIGVELAHDPRLADGAGAHLGRFHCPTHAL